MATHDQTKIMTRAKINYHYILILFFLFVSPPANALTSDVSVSGGLQSKISAPGETALETVWYEKDINQQPLIHLYFFWSKQCPHCLKARPDITSMEEEFSWLKLHSLELVDHPENVQTYLNMSAMFGNDARSVPTFMFCGNLLSGYESEETTGQLLKSYLQACYRFAEENDPDNSMAFTPDQNNPTSIDVPFFGDISPDDYSLPALTVFIAGMDAFNPCAFFVLLFLLSMMVHSRSRGRMALIGGIFVLFSGAIYFMFMAAWLNLFIYLGELRLITLIAGSVAMIIALVNIKDYFWFKKGFSLTIADDEKPKLFDRIRHLLRLDSLLTVIFATVILAIVANSYELLCTAGFPMIYTRILTLKFLPTESYYLYLLLYNLIYILPLLSIVVLFTIKLGSRKLSEQEGMVLKLLSGVMMLMLGLLLVVSPQLLNNVIAAATILIFAISITWVIVRITNNNNPK
ncbi:MAG: thioredoxin family protein [Gammaproteobacteria bacterium]|nr:thioredoxin family protein [Gammaproteobacteria bacterium]